MARKMLTVLGAAGLLGLCGVGGVALAANNYTATVVPNVPGGTYTWPYGVNNAGMVVGRADDSDGNNVAFVFENGVTTQLPNLTGGVSAQANSVNNLGVIVGTASNANGTSRAVKWEKIAGEWTVTDLGTLNAANTGLGYASRINDAGQIAGYATATAGYHSFIWNPGGGGTKTDLGTLGFSGNFAYSQGLGLSENGAVSGYAYMTFGGPEHGMYVPAGGGRAQDITPAGGGVGGTGPAQWHAVTSTGQLFGYIEGTITGGMYRAAIYANGQYTLIPQVAGLPEGYGYDMNDSGVAVGAMFQLNPVPQPNVFRAFKYENGQSADLNDITTGLPGVMTEAQDVSNSGLIVGEVDGPNGPIAVLLTPATVCRPDFNGQGGVTVQDIFDFLTAWFSGDTRADFNGQNGITVQDIFDFLSAWFTGC